MQIKHSSPDCYSSLIILFLGLQMNTHAFPLMTKLAHIKYSHLKK